MSSFSQASTVEGDIVCEPYLYGGGAIAIQNAGEFTEVRAYLTILLLNTVCGGFTLHLHTSQLLSELLDLCHVGRQRWSLTHIWSTSGMFG